jgi:hypothetical protein
MATETFFDFFTVLGNNWEDKVSEIETSGLYIADVLTIITSY